MLRFKDLQNKVYSGKTCIRFECTIQVDDETSIEAMFKRVNATQWNMQVIFGRTNEKDSEVYNFGYIMPKEGLPLELIAATGLKFFQLYLKQEVQTKSNMDFVLGNVLNDM